MGAVLLTELKSLQVLEASQGDNIAASKRNCLHYILIFVMGKERVRPTLIVLLHLTDQRRYFNPIHYDTFLHNVRINLLEINVLQLDLHWMRIEEVEN